MKKVNVFAFLVALVLTGVFNKSQAQVLVGGNLNLGLPSGNLAKGLGPGFGLNGDARYQLSEELLVGAQLGFETWGEKNNSGVKVRSIPFMLTGDYLVPMGNMKVYGGAMLGLANTKATVKVLGITAESKTTGLGFGLRAGMLYPISEGMNFNASLGYKSYANSGGAMGQICLNLGILMNLEM